MSKRYPLYILICILISAFNSCNSSSDSEPTEYSSNVAVKTFSLAEDDSVLNNLDSIFFTIDLVKREIYNADSLPKGTDIRKLVAKITYPLVTSATLKVTGGEIMKDTTINYATNSTDSIDFTGNVSLTLVSENGDETGIYQIKVNVHKMEPDSLYWNRMARRDLPSYTQPIAQKTVEYNDRVYCMIKEASQYVLSTVDDPANGNWSKTIITFPFTPVINSLTATDNSLYILSDDGSLFSSVDGKSWTDCGTKFYSLLGGYGSSLMGIINDNGTFKHNKYPQTSGDTPTIVDSDFPISGTSPAITYTNKWATSTQIIIIGGVSSTGKMVGDCWGYDGETWGKISETPIATVSDAMLIPYYAYKVDDLWQATKHTILLAIGGKHDNTVTNTVYVSFDSGVHWAKADDLLQLPDYIPGFINSQAIVISEEKTSRSSVVDEWEVYSSKKLPVWCSIVPENMARSYEITWDCPYIYMFGGTNIQGTLYNNIWRGVVNRLSFKPLI